MSLFGSPDSPVAPVLHPRHHWGPPRNPEKCCTLASRPCMFRAGEPYAIRPGSMRFGLSKMGSTWSYPIVSVRAQSRIVGVHHPRVNSRFIVGVDPCDFIEDIDMEMVHPAIALGVLAPHGSLAVRAWRCSVQVLSMNGLALQLLRPCQTLPDHMTGNTVLL